MSNTEETMAQISAIVMEYEAVELNSDEAIDEIILCLEELKEKDLEFYDES